MQWTVRYYLHQAKVWESRAMYSADKGDAGAKSYAIRMAAMWTDLATAANAKFMAVNQTYHTLL